MKQTILLFSLIILFSTCNLVSPDVIHIKGHVKGLNSSMVYFTNAYYRNDFLDSAIVEHGNFILYISSKKYMPPFLASICYKNGDGKIEKLFFKNRILSQPGKPGYVMDAFIPDTSYIFIRGDLTQSKYLDITAGMETKSLYATQMKDFGYLDDASQDKKDRIALFRSIIFQYPSSIYLLNCIIQNRSLYSKEELKNLFSAFNNNVTHNKYGRFLQQYIAGLSDSARKIAPLELPDQNGTLHPLYSNEALINVIFVWASWCAPCHNEIPVLKKINEMFQNKRINIIAISIDNDRKAWLNSLMTMNSDWTQLITQGPQADTIQRLLDFNSIPLTLFVSSNGREIQRFIGYAPSYEDEFEKVIKKQIKAHE